ncbi:glycosyltransferase [Cellulomonas citrea]|uniref:glycosyltransferase n=1 Tax=Cellulomonas citrea TaxID=1909423 RepID=UPI001B3570DA|nr:glycosyltransferase [Cellulomonas citrea]
MSTGVTAAAATFPATVVVVLTGPDPWATQCLCAVADRTPAQLYEFVLVDDASGGNDELLAALDGDVTVVRNAAPVGLVSARAQAAARALGRTLVFVEPDVEVGDGWLEPLLAAIEAQPSVDAVHPSVDGDATGSAAAAVIAVSRELFQSLNGPGAAADLADAVRLRGGRVRCEPRSRARRHHPGGGEPPRALSRQAVDLALAGRLAEAVNAAHLAIDDDPNDVAALTVLTTVATALAAHGRTGA